ncbi:Hypothetical protein BSSP2_I1608 [Brucella suis bv. 2]|nr:putative Fe-S protein [Brucella abortus A13334]AIB21706.1 Hypothetical protein BSPT1_I1621 [Brucella suis bv. 2]AIB31819.1 Hypothetical protein BSSP2_I1608 [Brucella suis bv. 2]
MRAAGISVEADNNEILSETPGGNGASCSYERCSFGENLRVLLAGFA